MRNCRNSLDLWKCSRIRGAREHHCLHSLSTYIVEVGTWSKHSIWPIRLPHCALGHLGQHPPCLQPASLPGCTQSCMPWDTSICVCLRFPQPACQGIPRDMNPGTPHLVRTSDSASWPNTYILHICHCTYILHRGCSYTKPLFQDWER